MTYLANQEREEYRFVQLDNQEQVLVTMGAILEDEEFHKLQLGLNLNTEPHRLSPGTSRLLS